MIYLVADGAKPQQHALMPHLLLANLFPTRAQTVDLTDTATLAKTKAASGALAENAVNLETPLAA